jgi:actin-related protein
MAMEVQFARIACAGIVGLVGVYYGKDVADKYLEIKALSVMPESYWATEQKKAETELKIAEIHEAAETKRKQEEIMYKKEKDEKDRAHQLEVMEKEKAYPDSYWIYKTEKVKTETTAKATVKKEETSLEKQKAAWNALSTGAELITRRFL